MIYYLCYLKERLFRFPIILHFQKKNHNFINKTTSLITSQSKTLEVKVTHGPLQSPVWVWWLCLQQAIVGLQVSVTHLWEGGVTLFHPRVRWRSLVSWEGNKNAKGKLYFPTEGKPLLFCLQTYFNNYIKTSTMQVFLINCKLSKIKIQYLTRAQSAGPRLQLVVEFKPSSTWKRTGKGSWRSDVQARSPLYNTFHNPR